MKSEFKKSKLPFTAKGVSIAGVVSCTPEISFENQHFLNNFTDQEISQVTKTTGVKSRYLAPPSLSSADLCTKAARRLIEKLDWDSTCIDGIILMTQTSSEALPSNACRVHHALGLSNEAFAFDINLGCSAYPYGLWVASSLISTGASRILLLAGDTISHIVNPDDRATALLFGDAGTATALESSGEDLWSFFLGTDGKGADALKASIGKYLKMEGSRVFEFTITEVPKLINTVDSFNNKPHDLYLLHQANEFMLKHIQKKCKLPIESFPINIDLYGNTSSATIPLLMTTNVKETLLKHKVNAS